MKWGDTIGNAKNARKILADNIVHNRIEKEWSQEEFADKLGSSSAYVSNLENGKRNVRIDYIEHIATTFNISLKDLFEERNNIEKNRLKRKNHH